MSKVFDALRKQNLRDREDIGRLENAEEKEQLWSSIDSRSVDAPLSRFIDTSRVLSLDIGTVSPIFPFDKEQQRAAAEQYRMIRTKILHRNDKPKLVLVSSAAKGDGKTVTSINLAAAFALRDDTRVLLVDGDLRRSRISNALGIPASPGLADLLSGIADVRSALIRAAQLPNLFVIPAGQTSARTAELLESVRWHLFVQQIRANFSIIICDGPPIATVADYELLEVACDGVIVVVRPDHTDRPLCMKALSTVNQQKLMGVVINGVDNWPLWKASEYSYYAEDAGDGSRLIEARPSQPGQIGG